MNLEGLALSIDEDYRVLEAARRLEPFSCGSFYVLGFSIEGFRIPDVQFSSWGCNWGGGGGGKSYFVWA